MRFSDDCDSLSGAEETEEDAETEEEAEQENAIDLENEVDDSQVSD